MSLGPLQNDVIIEFCNGSNSLEEGQNTHRTLSHNFERKGNDEKCLVHVFPYWTKLS